MVESCACKGIRFCALCENTERVRRLKFEEEDYEKYDCYVYTNGKAVRCPSLSYACSIEEAQQAVIDYGDSTNECIEMDGLILIPDFVSIEEEKMLMEKIDSVEWAPSQSGRRKQDYGPQVNFKHKKVKTTKFVGMPDYADMLLDKMKSHEPIRLGGYFPFEMCNLEYEEEKKSAIELHRDDMWIWGNRLISINLLAGSIMTLVHDATRRVCVVPMPRRSLLCMADTVRYEWRHGVLPNHIRGRRVALTMREAAPAFLPGGELFQKYGQELMRIGNQRVLLSIQ